MSSQTAEILRSAGMRATKPRISIVDALSLSREPQDVSDIECAIDGAADTVTIYRTLESLVRAGLVRVVELQKGRTFYERTDHGHHHHVVCRSCGRVDDITGCELDGIERALVRRTKHFSIIESHSLEFFGHCKACVSQ